MTQVLPKIVSFATLVALSGCRSCTAPAEPALALFPGMTIETVALPQKVSESKPGDTGFWPSVITHGSDVSIAFCDQSLGNANLASRQSDGTWTTQTIEGGGAAGKYMTAQWVDDHVEAIYLNQQDKTLHHAAQNATGFAITTIARDTADIGISGRFVIGPKKERVFVHYNTHNELLLTLGQTDGAALKWTNSKLHEAGAVHNIQVDVGFDDLGMLVTFADWRIGYSSMMLGRLPTFAPQPEGASAFQYREIDREDIAGLKSAIISDGRTQELFYMRGRGGKIMRAVMGKDQEYSTTSVFDNASNFAMLRLSDGRVALAAAVGLDNGLGETALQLAVYDGKSWQRGWIETKRPVGQYIALGQTLTAGGIVLYVAFYDGTQKSLRAARLVL